ncbi:MAG: acyl-CoA dehydrogenase family protein [Pseudobdellovibrionaceae bacterium]
MKTFEELDLMGLNSALSEQERMIRDTVRTFVDKEIMPVIGDCYDRGEFPKQIIPGLANLGILGASLEGYGCAGMSSTEYGLIMQEIERGDSGIRSFASVQGALCMYPIHTYASEELKRHFLPKMALGEWIGCFGLTEADFGSNPGGMRTTAKLQGDHYVLNGSKMWITNGNLAKLAIVWAKDDHGDMIGLIVETNLPGFSARVIEKKFSLKASITSELFFDNVKVPVTHKLNVKGLKGPFSCLNQARFGIAWGAIGAAQACFDEALSYAKTRIQFDKPLAAYQLVQAKLANIATEITKMQWMTLQLGRLKDAGLVQPHQISLCKMNNVSTALDIARTCRDILGASGITYEYQVGRHMLNLESVNTYEGTEDIHRLIVGEKITGFPAYR